MDTKLALISFIDIVLRVPSLFMLDEAFQSNLADLGLYPSSLLPLHKEADFDFVTGGENHTLLKPHRSIDNYDSKVFGNLSQSHRKVIEYGVTDTAFSYFDNVIYGSVLGHVVQIILLLLGTTLSLFTLTLWTKHLVRLYEFLFTMLLIAISYHCNEHIYNATASSSSSLLTLMINMDLEGIFQMIPSFIYTICNMATQSVLASGYLFVTLGAPPAVVQGLIVLSFVVPSFAVMLPFHYEWIPFCGIIIPSLHVVAVALYHLPKVYREVKDRIDFVVATIRVEGLVAFIETEWLRLNIPMVFRTFWISRCALQLYIFLSSSEQEWDQEAISTLVKILLVRGCETLPSILGMASMFSWITNKTYKLCLRFLLVPNEEGSMHVGPVSAILFIILAFQNGLSALKPAARIIRLLRNIFLLVACFLHFIHNAVDPVLMSLAASANPDIGRHIRALLVCGILTLVTLGGLISLWSYHFMSTWLLAVTGFSVEVLSKVFISLALYGLFLADASKYNEFWDQLDDHVYRVRCFGRAVEFLVGLFLLFNSAFILIFESGGAIRAVLVALHAYFNLWCEARAGWKTFSRRRTAVHKISTLQTVTCSEELEDVCAICFHELKHTGSNQATVKVTPCRHYFHAVCLRKWLYVQDRCPMCHSTLWPQSQLQPGDEAHNDQQHQE